MRRAITKPLTTGADVGTAFKGAGANDVFVGAIGGDGTPGNGTTLNPGDSLDGGAGSNKLSVSVSGTNGSAQTSASFSLANIQQLEVANFETTAFDTTIDLANGSSVNDVAISSSSATGDTILSSVQGLVAATMKNGAGDLTIQYAAAAVAGTADVQALKLSGQTAGTFTADGIETLNITSDTATNTTTIVGTAIKTVNVSGDKGLALGTLPATVTAVSAAGVTAGNVSLTGGTAVNYTITGGAGNDTITISTGFTTGDIIDGGGGTNNTLSIASAITAGADLAKVTNIQTLKTSADVTLAANVVPTTFDITDSGNQIVTLNAGYTAATTIKLTGDSTNADKVVNSANVELTVVGNVGDIDAATTITGGSGNDVLTLTADADTATTTLLTGVERITIAAGTLATSGATVAMGANDSQIAAGKSLVVDASALSSTAVFTFTGTASELDGYVSVTGGAGNDAITGTASGRDTLVGGDGNDTFTLVTLASTNVVNGGNGTGDKLAVTTDIASAAAFTGVTGIETLVLGSSTDLTLAASIAASTGITLIDASDASDNIITLNTGYTDATTIKLTGDSTNADKIVNSANVALTVNANDADIDAGTTITGGTGVDTINLTATGGTATITAVSKVETINVLPSTTLGTAATVVMGANDTQIAAAKTLSVNASTITDSTAVFTFTGTTSETDGYLSVTGGSGNDVISGGASGFDTLDGGAGNDAISIATLAVTNVIRGGAGTGDSLTVTTDIGAASNLMGVTGIETLILGSSTDLTLAASIAASTGITLIDASDPSDNIITLNAGYTDATTIKLTGDSTNADKIVNTANVALTITANAADIDAGTTITGGTGVDTINLRADSDATGATLTAVSGVDKIVLVVGSTASATAKISMGAVDTQIAAGKSLTVDASALTNTAAAVTFVGDAAETDGSVVFIGGAGADVFTGGAYMDTVTGGSGADTVTFAAQANKLTYDTFTDAATGDILNTANKGTEVFTTAKVSLGTAATFSDYLDSAAAGDGSTNGIYRWFNFGGNTYVTFDVSAGATFVSGTDMVIELVGVKDLSSSTVGDHILTLSVA